MMTREDMLRELELLPVWQLRTPLPSPDLFQAEPKLLKPVVIEPAIEKLDAANAQLLMHIGSEDGAWLFVMANEVLQADEAQLLKNICKAMHIITMPEEMSHNFIWICAHCDYCSPVNSGPSAISDAAARCRFGGHHACRKAACLATGEETTVRAAPEEHPRRCTGCADGN